MQRGDVDLQQEGAGRDEEEGEPSLPRGGAAPNSLPGALAVRQLWRQLPHLGPHIGGGLLPDNHAVVKRAGRQQAAILGVRKGGLPDWALVPAQVSQVGDLLAGNVEYLQELAGAACLSYSQLHPELAAPADTLPMAPCAHSRTLIFRSELHVASRFP